MRQTDLINANFTSANLSGANLSSSYSKNAIFTNVKISPSTELDSCFEPDDLDKIICHVIRKLNPDSPPFYGEMRNYHRSDLG